MPPSSFTQTGLTARPAANSATTAGVATYPFGGPASFTRGSLPRGLPVARRHAGEPMYVGCHQDQKIASVRSRSASHGRVAALILDDVRCGFRLSLAGSWAPLGVRPDLSAWSKAIANGYALGAVLGNDRFRDGARRIFTTGSFWFSAVSMAAAVATIETMREIDAVAVMTHAGQRLRDGLAAQAAAHGLAINQTGPVQMPFLTFVGDENFAMANVFTGAAACRGVYMHPWHNWFMSTAHTDDDIDAALAVTDDAFAAVHQAFGGS